MGEASRWERTVSELQRREQATHHSRKRLKQNGVLKMLEHWPSAARAP
jgi:hypothetical protein